MHKKERKKESRFPLGVFLRFITVYSKLKRRKEEEEEE
jgi:hypothetical protein